MQPNIRSALGFLAMLIAAIGLPLAIDPSVSLQSVPLIVAINCLPTVLLVLALFALTRKAALSLAMGSLPVVLLHYANALKSQVLSNVVMMQDFALLPQILANPDLFGSYISMSGRTWLLIALAVASVALLIWKEPKILTRHGGVRVSLLVVSALGLAFLFSGNRGVQAFYVSETGLQHAAFPQKVVERVGLVGSMLYFNSRANDSVEQVDLKRISGFVAMHAKAITALREHRMPVHPPDIIMVQYEALFDPTTLKGMQDSGMFSQFHALQQQGTSGYMASPAFGGITIKAEFEVLTGYPYIAFREVIYPYYGTVNTATNSLPRLLDKQGYRTTAVHPYKAGFWNRKTALHQLGFESSHFLEDFETARKEGPYVADAELFDRALRYADQPGPDFVFAITMENHGPWIWPGRLKAQTPQWSTLPVPDGYQGDARIELQKYLWHVQHGQAALANLAAAVQRRKTPTILVVYGDHLPAFRAAFADAEFINGLPAKAQRVPYFILDNRDASQRRIDGSLYLLPAMLLARAGIPMNEYFAIVSQAGKGYVSASSPYSAPTDLLMVEMARADYAGKLPAITP